jgi:hypothetical protein
VIDERLTRTAAWFRVFHTVVAVVELAALVDVWACAWARRRGPVLRVAVTALAVEAIALVIGRGDCPLGPLQRELGDPVPLFELVLPARAAKAAVPVLAAASVAGLVLVALRRPIGSDAPRSR